MKKRKLNFDYLNFLPFEREQFEEYLNTLYLDGVHLVAGKHVVECEETSIRFYYRVAYFPKNKQEQEDLKETYKKFGYDYVGEIHHFGIFESLENHPVFINEMIEEEMLMPIVKKEWIKNVIGLSLGLIAIIMFYYYFSQTTFLSNDTLIAIVYSILGLIVLGLTFPRAYLGYLNRKVMNYSYRLCMMRGYFSKFIFTLIIMRSGFFMGTQSIIIALMIPIMFIVLGVIVYKYYHGNHLSDIYNYLFVAVIVVSFVGAFLKDEFVKESKIMSSNIVELNDFYEIKREETIFLDYAVYRKNEKELEYVDIKYKGYDDYVFDKIADGDKIVATDRIDGYDIGYSKDYIYISKDRNILKTNIIRDVHEFVRKLNW